jgi:hypothetical protein
MGRIKIEIDGTQYDIDSESEDELLQYLGLNAEFGKKKRFQFAQKVISSTMPAIKTGIGFLAGATQKAVSVEHSHEDHREPHYKDSFERSKDHQAEQEAGYVDRFSEGIDVMHEKLSQRAEESPNKFNEYFERNMGEMYEQRRAIKKIKLRRKRLHKKNGLNEQNR